MSGGRLGWGAGAIARSIWERFGLAVDCRSLERRSLTVFGVSWFSSAWF